ncbi:MAG: hypothetical protein ACXWBN_12230 [Acidimicrobiales bacterium]
MNDWDEGSVLLAVFESRVAADRAAESVARIGQDRGRIAIARPSDEVASVKAEMQDEMDESWTSPQAGVAYPKEAAKGLALLLPVCCVIGGLLIGPLGFIGMSGVALWLRLLVAASIGVLMGGTVALVAAPALAANRSDDHLAGERGVVVRVDGTRPDIVEALIASDPIRLDRRGGRGR